MQPLMTRALRVAIFAALAWGASPCTAKAAADESYPIRPIRMIVESSAGAADDFFARSLGRELEAFYGSASSWKTVRARAA